MGRTKSRPRPLKKNRNKFLGLGLPTPRQRLERCNIYKLCVTKLARIADPGAKLCKAVLINNTLRRLETQPEQYEYSTPQENISCEHKNICTDYTAEEEEEEVEEEVEMQGPDTATAPLVSRVPTLGLGSVATLAMCDDIIQEFLGGSRDGKAADMPDLEHSPASEDNKENIEAGANTGEAEGGGQDIGGKLVSPYSYSSFLSEVYSITLRKIKYKVEL